MTPSATDAFVRIGWDNSQARGGVNDLVSLSNQAKQRVEKNLSSIGAGVRFASAFAGMNGAASVVEKSLNAVKRGFEFNELLDNSQVGIANVLRRFDGLNQVAAKNEAAKALARLVELEPKAAGTLADLTGGFMGSIAAAKGIGLTTAQNIELVAQFANAVANSGLPLEQLRQEFTSILSGTITKDSKVAKNLGITNEDVNVIRGNGDAVFTFLTQKLGAFAEAGDSAQVTFSSLDSAIDKGLGAMTQQLFQVAIKHAKELTTQLQDPKWVANMQEAGVDIGRVAESLAKIGAVLVQWAPVAVRFGTSLASVVPTLAAIGVALAAMKLGNVVKDKVALTAATETFTQKVQRETQALLAHNAALAGSAKGPAVGRTPQTGPDTRGFAGSSSIAVGLIPEVAVARAGGKAAETFVGGFRSAFGKFTNSAGMNMASDMGAMAPLMIAGLKTAMTDRSKGLGGVVGKMIGGNAGEAIGPAIIDGVSVGLSMLPKPYGVLAPIALQTIDSAASLGSYAAEKFITYFNKGKSESEARGGTSNIRSLLDKGDIEGASKARDSQLERARKGLDHARANGESTSELQNEVNMLEAMQRDWGAWIQRSASTQKAAAAERKATESEIEATVKRAKEVEDARVKNWEKIHGLAKDLLDSKISLLPDDQKIGALGAKLRRVFQEAGLGASLQKQVMGPNGKPMFSGAESQAGKVNSVADLERIAKAQQSQGDAAGGAKTLERLREALELQTKIDNLQKEMRQQAADAGQSKDELQNKRELFALETAIEQAIAESGDAESKKVQALQDQLKAKQLAKELQTSLNLAEADALAMAQQRVAFERQAAAARARMDAQKQAQSQATDKADMAAELVILRAQAAGKDEIAQKLQRELDIRREARQIAQAAGLTEEQALALAREKARLEDQASARKSAKESGKAGATGEDRKIRGYSWEKQGSMADADARRAEREKTLAARRQAAHRRSFSGLEGFYGRPGNSFGNFTNELPNPAAGKAQENAANQDKVKEKPPATPMELMEKKFDDLIEVVKRLGGTA